MRTPATGQEARQYTLAISSLKDFRGLEIGRLLMLRDVTGIKTAEVQILEHQRRWLPPRNASFSPMAA